MRNNGQNTLKPHQIWPEITPPEACVIVIFGATGDLAQRKLLPTLAHLIHDHPTPETFYIIAFARRPLSNDQWRKMTLESLNTYMPEDDRLDDVSQHAFAQRMFYCQAEFHEQEGYQRLGEMLDGLDRDCGTRGNRLFYFATPASFYGLLAENLGKAGLTKPAKNEYADADAWTRVIVEKPFGTDLETAQHLNEVLHTVLEEQQIYRIDHYLGKETVQNILAFRFANGIFEPLWNHSHIDHVQILVGEELGIGTRADYYDGTGALRDIVQNHMLQLLCLIGMEAPISYDAEAIRDEKVKLLRAIQPLTPEQVRANVVAGQYTAGTMHGLAEEGYHQEAGVPASSRTETYVALKLSIENWRWGGVPFYLRTGKRLPMRATEITIQFKRVPHMLYKPSDTEGLVPNRLIIRIQPDEGISLEVGAKIPGMAQHLRTVKMSFDYNESFGIELPEAYERLIVDCILGDSTLFIRKDEIEAAWKIVDSITRVWQDTSEHAPAHYVVDTWGPEEATKLMQDDGREWLSPEVDTL